MISSRLDRGGLRAAFDASLEIPCIKEKLQNISFEMFSELVKDMRVLSFYDGLNPIGAAVFDGDSGHIGIIPEYHCKWLNKQTLKAIKETWGNSPVAFVDSRNIKALRFTSGLGLKPESQDGHMVRFK